MNHLNDKQPHHAPHGYENAPQYPHQPAQHHQHVQHHQPAQYHQPEQYQPSADELPKPHANKPRPKKRGRFRRFARGYLQITGALVNLYVLVILLVQLFVLLQKYVSLV